ncbi:hypothetical protein OSSY52_09320 [Tepiditoga spiralis]|uniref:GGDEF domain-containing protein n=1 Tax=Tepiditoga spiralis TaxID=2108365 RepID=A0A7G1G353_9BACT|nr:GGDEF domain-containing protein [Tepiditoga spiralis]BBE30791.1 hypothetical protein OSSY52_09320 [Tepiditoga spiralis]
MKREVSVMYNIISSEIQKQINTFFLKYYNSGIKDYYVSILFFVINNSYEETNIEKYIKKTLFFINTNLGTNFKLTNNETEIKIGNSNEFYGYLDTGDFVDYSFLKVFSDIFYLSLKRVNLNKNYKETLNFSQFILDNIENIIIVLDEKKNIINYNLQALTHFGKKLINSKIFDLIGINKNIFNFENQLDKKEFDYFNYDYYYKIRISSYKNKKYIVDIYPQKIFDYLKSNVTTNNNFKFEESDLLINYSNELKKIFDSNVSITVYNFNKKIFFYSTKSSFSSKIKYLIELNENYKVYFEFDSIIKTNSTILKEIENTLNINFKVKRDALTTLYRKEKLFKEVQNVISNKKDALLMIIDINDFKNFNDKNGHIFGDIILKKFSEALISSFRNNDIICRLGGDEFGILMFGQYSGKEIKYINRINKKLKGVIEFSYGCSKINGTKDTLEEYFEEADKNMYLNKKTTKRREFS